MKKPLIILIYLIISSFLLGCQDEVILNNGNNELKGQLTQLPKKVNASAIDFNSKEEMIQFFSILEKGKLSKADSIKVFELSLKSMNDSTRQNFINQFLSDAKIQLLGSEDEIEICSDCLNNNNPKGSVRFNLDWLRNFSANFSWNRNGEIENVVSRLDGFFFGGSYIQDYWNQFGGLQPNGDLQFIIGGHWEIIVSVNGSLNFGDSHQIEEVYITYNTLTGNYFISSYKPTTWKIK
jgi:hypothetical protein